MQGTGTLRKLPNEVVTLIFEFDPTFHLQFRKCCWEIQNMGIFSKVRLVRELERLRAHPGMEVGMLTTVARRLEIEYLDKHYVLTVPAAYPWEPPGVTVDGKKVRPFDLWTPSGTLFSVLLFCHVEATYGRELC